MARENPCENLISDVMERLTSERALRERLGMDADRPLESLRDLHFPGPDDFFDRARLWFPAIIDVEDPCGTLAKIKRQMSRFMDITNRLLVMMQMREAGYDPDGVSYTALHTYIKHGIRICTREANKLLGEIEKEAKPMLETTMLFVEVFQNFAH